MGGFTSGSFKKGHKSGMTGKRHSEETKRKIGLANKGRPCAAGSEKGWFKKGHSVSPATQFRKGNIPWNAGIGITPEKHKIKMRKRYMEFRKSILARDNYTCQHCNKRGGKLQVHHIKEFAAFPELIYEPSNVVTLCIPCHRKTDNYGQKTRARMKHYKQESA